MIHRNVQIAGDCYDIVAAKLDDPPSEVSRVMTTPSKSLGFWKRWQETNI